MTRCQRRRINRQNAQKSTGPRSPEGKDASRRNALAHGLRAETLTLPNEDPAEIAARTEAWFDHYEPDGPAERALVEQAALASLRLHRCARFEQATLAKQVREAERDWDRRQEDELARCRTLLPTDPAEAVRALQDFGAGRRWLLEQWETLWTKLSADHGWSSSADCEQAIRLLGVDLQQIRESPAGFALVLFNLAAQPAPTEAHVAWVRDPKHVPPSLRGRVAEGLPDRAASLRELARIVADEVVKAVTLADGSDEFEKADRAEARDRALLVGDPPTAGLLLRYQASAQSAFHRAYNALTRLDNEVVDEEEQAPVKAAAPNEAKPADRPMVKIDPKKVCDEAKVTVLEPSSWTVVAIEAGSPGICPQMTQIDTDKKSKICVGRPGCSQPSLSTFS